MARIQNRIDFVSIAAQTTAAATKALLVATAKREHAIIMRQAGGALPFKRTVDGVKDAIEDAAKPYGVIQYDYFRLEEAVEFAMQILFDYSPVLKDDYRRSHTLLMNGAEVRNLQGWEPGDEVVILNPVPYARKIEQGRMQMRIPGTDHVYERAQRTVQRRFGNIVNTRFTYRSATLPYIAGASTRAGRAQLRQQPARRSAMAMERASRVPALVFDEYV